MDKHQMPISIAKDEETIGFLITMMSVISKMGADREVTQEGSNLIIRQRTPEEIVTLDRDISGLKDKIFDWFDQRTSRAPLVLNEEDSSLLRYSAHAAYYFLTEEDRDGVLDERFIRLYNQYFKVD